MHSVVLWWVVFDEPSVGVFDVFHVAVGDGVMERYLYSFVYLRKGYYVFFNGQG